MNVLQEMGNLLRAAGGMFVVLGIWVLIQALVRRRSGCKNPDKDVLESMVHGCAECRGHGSCHRDEEREADQPAGVRGAR